MHTVNHHDHRLAAEAQAAAMRVAAAAVALDGAHSLVHAIEQRGRLVARLEGAQQTGYEIPQTCTHWGFDEHMSGQHQAEDLKGELRWAVSERDLAVGQLRLSVDRLADAAMAYLRAVEEG